MRRVLLLVGGMALLGAMAPWLPEGLWQRGLAWSVLLGLGLGVGVAAVFLMGGALAYLTASAAHRVELALKRELLAGGPTEATQGQLSLSPADPQAGQLSELEPPGPRPAPYR